jgi:flagellar biosynthesis protein FlhF
MNVRKFIAATARDALRKVKETLGPDAIILSNRGIPGGVEIMAVAARDMEMIVPTREYESTLPRRKESAASPSVESTPLRVAAPAQQPAPAQPAGYRTARSLPPRAARSAPAPAAQPLIGSAPPPAADVVPAAVMEEIRTLRRIVEQQLAGFAWGEAARANRQRPRLFATCSTPAFRRSSHATCWLTCRAIWMQGQALAWVKGVAERAMLTINGETDIVDQGGIYALVGPTGVGKTTTTAKLAARCVLRHGARKLALVTTDGYRIGAHEQLRIYGRILGVSVHLARDAKDLRATLRDLQHTHMVLIDTMGMSQRDRMVSEQVAMFGDSDVKSLLLLSATSRGDTLDDVVRAYSGLDLAGCVLTKVDEAASLASSLDVIIRMVCVCTMFRMGSGYRKICICRIDHTCCIVLSRICPRLRRIAWPVSSPA